MNALPTVNQADALLIWSINLVLQVTLVAGFAILIAHLLRRAAAVRYGVLFAALGAICLAPIITSLSTGLGYGRLSLALYQAPLDAADTGWKPIDAVSGMNHELTAREDVGADRVEFRDVEADPSDPIAFANSLEQIGDVAESVAGLEDNDALESDGADAEEVSHGAGEVAISCVENGRFAEGSMAGGSGDELQLSNMLVALRVMGAILGLVWLVGFVISSLRISSGMRRSLSVIRQAQTVQDKRVLEIAEATRELLGLEKSVPIEWGQGISSPIAVGVIRPRVILPEGIDNLVDEIQLRDILVHEFAHLMRRDQILVLIQFVIGSVFWFHPLVRLLNRRLSQAREEVCDNYVLASSDAPTYSRTLLEMAKLMRVRSELPGTVGFLTANWKLESRVRGLLDSRRKPMTTNPRAVKCAVFVFALGMMALPLMVSIRSAVAGTEQPRNEVVNVDPQLEPENRTAVTPLHPRVVSPITVSQRTDEETVESIDVAGIVLDSEGDPLVSASVAIIGLTTRLKQAGDFSSRIDVLGELETDVEGRFEISLEDFQSSEYANVSIMAGYSGMGISWETLNTEIKQHELRFELQPEAPIRCRLIDLEGQPIPGVEITVESVMENDGSDFPMNSVRLERLPNAPTLWPTSVTSDDKGQFTIHGIREGCGVYLKSEGTDRFAPQGMSVNTGQPEQRGEYDATYRALVKNVGADEEAILTLPPATLFAGTVRFEDSREAVPNADLSVFSSQQDVGGSMIGLAGSADENGDFVLNPYPGVRFELLAYPPKGTPYLTRRIRDLRDADGDEPNRMDITLPRGVLVRGVVTNSETGEPISGASIQYIPERLNNPNILRDVVTGWQAIQLTNDQGEFSIPVYAGPGTLAVSGGMGKYVLKQVGSRMLSQGATGGKRNYAHAFESLDPTLEENEINVAIKLDPGHTVAGNLTDQDGTPIESAMTISSLRLHPLNLTWRSAGGMPLIAGNGKYQLDGLPSGEDSEVFFLDAQRRLGATVMLNTESDSHDVQLLPCGQAHLRIVDENGEAKVGARPTVYLLVKPGSPMRDQLPSEGEYIADTDFIQNIDRVNHRNNLATDENGEVTIKALIPGATYRLMGRVDGRFGIVKEWVAESGETTELGQVTFPGR